MLTLPEFCILPYWVDFFLEAGIEEEDAFSYAKNFFKQKIHTKILSRLTAQKLEKLGVAELGNQESILKHIEEVGEVYFAYYIY